MAVAKQRTSRRVTRARGSAAAGDPIRTGVPAGRKATREPAGEVRDAARQPAKKKTGKGTGR